MAVVHVHSWRRYVGLALVTASILALQITFTRVFSIMIWHHFTYLIIGVALLGGGASGTFLAVRGWSAATLERRLGGLVIGYSLIVLLNLAIIGGIAIDPLRGSQIVQTLIGLAIYFVGLFTTFFLGGVIVSGVFTIWHKEAHRLYFADMLGAGAATLAVVWVIQALGGPATIVATALLVLAGSLLFGVGLTRPWRSGARRRAGRADPVVDPRFAAAPAGSGIEGTWMGAATLRRSTGVHPLESGWARGCAADHPGQRTDDRRRHQPGLSGERRISAGAIVRPETGHA
jgi:hypothetical protein